MRTKRHLSGTPSVPGPGTDRLPVPRAIGRRDLFMALLTGILLTGAFPDTGAAPLAWAALLPLFAALQGQTARQGFRLGFVAGLAHHATLLYWVVYTMRIYGHLPLYLCLPVHLLLAAYLSLYTGLFGAAVIALCRKPVWMPLLVPALWVSLEYLRAVLLSGFPWEILGYAQYRYLPLIQIADITGVYGVSFWTVLANVALFQVYARITGRTWFGAAISRRQAAVAAVGFATVSATLLGYGAWRIAAVDRQAASHPPARVAVVQGNVDQAVKWAPQFQRSTVQKYVDLSREAAKSSPELVVWPETATPFYFDRNEGFSALIRRGIAQSGADFLIGSPSYTARGNRIAYYNSAYLIHGDGRIAGKYDKVHLVPFGEYVPFKRWMPFLGKMVEQVGDFTPGSQGRTLAWKERPLGLLICYEIIFPRLARSMVRNRAALLVNITNDAWFGRTAAPAQHFSMAVFRAVENHRSLVRAANTGISGFIDPAGRILGRTRLMASTAPVRNVPVLAMKSLYTQFGDLFAWLCLAVSAIAMAGLGFGRKGMSRQKGSWP
jgi:apolipoprotein N-acyltransferase